MIEGNPHIFPLWNFRKEFIVFLRFEKSRKLGLGEGITTHKLTSHSSNIKALEIVCNPKVAILNNFDMGSNLT